MKFKWRKWFLIVVALFGLGLLFFHRPLRIEFHRGYLRDGRWSDRSEPQTWKGYLSPQYLRWRLHGRPDFQKRVEAAKRHEDALVEMGYFERRIYFPTNLRHDWVRRVRTNAMKDELMFFRRDLEGKWEALAHPEDFPMIERVMREMEAAGPLMGEFE